MEIPFVKAHGLGNDFVLVDEAHVAALDLAGEGARSICDRHRGVGADGLLVCRTAPAAPSMRVLNADGSVARMCGNGLRCVARWLVERHGAPDAFAVATDAGPRRCEVVRDEAGSVRAVRVQMGRPQWAAAEVPFEFQDAREGLLLRELSLGGQRLRLSAVGLGNPHAVVIGTFDAERRASLGPAICNARLFPEQANVSFVDVVGLDALRVHVWERGCGFTQACGTAACAAATVAVRAGLAAAERDLRVELPGGILHVRVEADLGQVWLEGPATIVFDGTLRWPLPD